MKRAVANLAAALFLFIILVVAIVPLTIAATPLQVERKAPLPEVVPAIAMSLTLAVVSMSGYPATATSASCPMSC